MRRVYLRKNKPTTLIAAILGIMFVCICGQLFSEQSAEPSPATVVINTSTPLEIAQSDPQENTQTPNSSTATETIEQNPILAPNCIPEQHPVQAHITSVVDGDTVKVISPVKSSRLD